MRHIKVIAKYIIKYAAKHNLMLKNTCPHKLMSIMK